MIINPSAPMNIQGIEELQGSEGSAAKLPFGQGASFENTLSTMEGEGKFEVPLLLMSDDKISQDELEKGENAAGNGEILLASLPAVSGELKLQSEEATLKTAPVNLTTDQTKTQLLPLEDNVAQLKEQVANMGQTPSAHAKELSSVMPENLSEAENFEVPSISNVKSVLHPVQSNNTEGIASIEGEHAEQIPVSADPRIQTKNVSANTFERSEVSIDEQLDQASVRLDLEKNSLNDPKTKGAAAISTGTLIYNDEVQPEESTAKRQLMQQFRTITAEESLQSKGPQALGNFTDNINFDQAVNPTGNANDFTVKNSSSKRPIPRNTPELSEVFVKTDQEEIVQDLDSLPEGDTGFDQVLKELGDRTETSASKENNRPILAESTSSRSFSKDVNTNLDQIMSKVNFKDNGIKEMTLQLTPRELGEVTMKFHQEENTMAVHMIVGSMEAKQMLEASLPELRARFLEQDNGSFDQMQFSVDVEQQSFSRSDQAPEQGGFEDDYIGNRQKEVVEAKVPVSQQYKKAGFNSGLNIYA
ncbi:MAG: flagellar hook-length control protein FliK [SAR324 cluster bacterium]|nr:flagellar hook-length control protein FliK [SAR324 cluster bacterium]